MRQGRGVQNIKARKATADSMDTGRIFAIPRGIPALIQCLHLYVAAHPEKFRRQTRQVGQRRVCTVTVVDDRKRQS